MTVGANLMGCPSPHVLYTTPHPLPKANSQTCSPLHDTNLPSTFLRALFKFRRVMRTNSGSSGSSHDTGGAAHKSL